MSGTLDQRNSRFVEARAELLRSLRAAPSGLEWCGRHSDLVDELVRTVYAGLLSKLEDVPALAVVATGGYGRRELAPWSDVDLTIVPLDESHHELESAVKTLFRDLHDALADSLGMKLGYALRFAADCPGLDPKTRSGLLDARLVVGSPEALDALTSALWATFPVAEFVIDKIEEQRDWWARSHDTPLATQPDLKHGAGGLRSFQSANWIRAAIGERMTGASPDYDHVLLVRNLLHLVTEKHHDHLTHDRRSEVASVTGEDPRALGSRLARSMSVLHEGYLMCVERLGESRFPLGPHVEAVRGEARIDARATAGQAALGIANATRLGLGVSDFVVPQPGASANQALSAITAGEQTLRNLDRAGVLDALLPELTACRTLMPLDASHDFSVFEHTLRVVRHLDNPPADSFLGSIRSDLRDAAPLYLAALLHDVGRAVDEGTHAEVGAQIAERVCDRWGVYESTKETVCWLVSEHLTLDRTMRMRDVSHPETAIEFAARVGSPERLAMLALLTWADVSAVNATAWTPAQETFLRELYTRTLMAMTAEEAPSTDSAVYRRRMLELSKGHDVPQEAFQLYLDSMPAHYLIGTEPALARAHFGLVQAAKSGEVSVVVHDVADMGATDVTVCCADAKGLLSRILAVLYALDLSIIAIRASTTKDDAPVALDSVTVAFGGRPVPRATAKRLVETMTKVLKGEQDARDTLVAAKKEPDRAQEVLTYQFVAGDPAIVEVQAPRGRGLAYRLARQLSQAGVNILSARVGQWAGSGTAAFYVTGSDGRQPDPALVAKALNPPKV